MTPGSSKPGSSKPGNPTSHERAAGEQTPTRSGLPPNGGTHPFEAERGAAPGRVRDFRRMAALGERPTAAAARILSERAPLATSISLVLPAYNEVECIGEAIETAAEALDEGFNDWELIVVDDGSSDGTGDVLAAALEHDDRIRVVDHGQNRGDGAALASGFRAATKVLVGYTDADLQFDVKEFVPLAERLMTDEIDVVYGFRIYRYDAVLRCILSWTYNRLVRVLFGIRVRDVDCAFKLFRRESVQSMQLESTDFFVDTEMLAETRRLGLRMAEQGVRHYPRFAGSTTVRPSDIPRTLFTVARMWWQIRRRPRVSRQA
ncbi:MAG: glycosyltransferase family 2 protein [Planctomycetota bacterium]|jgi:dolichol-phosphate mannosyltransferase